MEKEPDIVSPNHKSQITNQQSVQGFTLTEILLVVAIIAMIGGLGGGYGVNSYRKLLVEKSARQFLLMARYARIVAIERQRPYELLLDPNNEGFFLTTVETDPRTGESQKVLVRDYFCRPVKFEGDVKFEDMRLLAYGQGASEGLSLEGRILFYPSGAADSAIVQIGDGKTHYSIAIVAATGKATLHPGPIGEVRTGSVDLDAQEGDGALVR